MKMIEQDIMIETGSLAPSDTASKTTSARRRQLLELRPGYTKRSSDREIACTGPVGKTKLSSSRNGMKANEEKGGCIKQGQLLA